MSSFSKNNHTEAKQEMSLIMIHGMIEYSSGFGDLQKCAYVFCCFSFCQKQRKETLITLLS
jgi:Zn-finger protein